MWRLKIGTLLITKVLPPIIPVKNPLKKLCFTAWNKLYGLIIASKVRWDYKNFVTEQTQAKNIIQQNPNVAAVVSSVGQGADASASTNTGHLLIKLKPTSERRVNAAKIIQQLRHQLQPVPGLRIFLTNPPAISIGGKTTNSHYQYVLQGMD